MVGSVLSSASDPAAADGFSAELDAVLDAAFRLARAAGCSPDDAADAVQEASIAAWRKRAQLRGEFRPWFLTIVHRRAIRRRRAWPTLTPLRRADAEPWPADDTLDPDLVAALRALPADHRAALWLRYGLDMSTADVATVLGRSEAAAKQLLFRARSAARLQMTTESAT